MAKKSRKKCRVSGKEKSRKHGKKVWAKKWAYQASVRRYTSAQTAILCCEKVGLLMV
jgi:hypothetical protein